MGMSVGTINYFWLKGTPKFVIGAIMSILPRRGCSFRYKGHYGPNKLFLAKRGSSVRHRRDYGHFG